MPRWSARYLPEDTKAPRFIIALIRCGDDWPKLIKDAIIVFVNEHDLCHHLGERPRVRDSDGSWIIGAGKPEKDCSVHDAASEADNELVHPLCVPNPGLILFVGLGCNGGRYLVSGGLIRRPPDILQPVG
eukprot:3934353-Rhodomonas_salina.4